MKTLNFIILILTLITFIYSYVPCSFTFFCPDYSTCCRGIYGWGCCPGYSAVCCSDGISCCPPGHYCDLYRRICVYKASDSMRFLFKSSELQPQIINFKTENEMSKIFNGTLIGIKMYKNLPDCIIFDEKLLTNMEFVLEKILLINQDDIDKPLNEIANYSKEIAKNLIEITKKCENNHNDNKVLLEKLLTYISEEDNESTIKYYIFKNFKEIKEKVLELANNTQDPFNYGKISGEIIALVLFPQD